ncbi:MAG: tRNA (adenosine(37)-N6)-dimethylallyltransferase MiaA [Candidatus Eisenbacteria bacterium]
MSSEPAPSSRQNVLTVVGPTAVGKTAVAIALARSTGAEIVSADSRQVCRGLDVGTAKPTIEERRLVRHHLIDIDDPSEDYDAARFAADAEAAIADIGARGLVPLVVGGTGFYVASLFEGLFEGPGRDPEVRANLAERAATEGVEALHGELAGVDPASARRIHVNDTSRIVRALEVYATTGTPLSEWHAGPGRTPAFTARYVGLTLPRETLRTRIDRRVDAMMAGGLLDEIGRLVSTGALSSAMPAANAVGYRELLPIVEGGEGSTDEAVELIKRNTRRYAKRQMTWFRSIEGIEWFDLGGVAPGEAARAILASAGEPGGPTPDRPAR